VIDGQENPLAQIWGSKLYEVQEYLSLTGHVYTPGYVVVSPSRWDRLPATVRAILEEEAKATQAFVHETATRLDAELLDQIREAGVLVNSPDRSAFERSSAPIYDEFARTVEGGGDLVERAIATGSN
jgi:TRAP-type C4-dicarboxylate transport system substrate-binding protein